jgi:malate dehydrogenase (oxaloacetate-decarboxylating)(NADP+)
MDSGVATRPIDDLDEYRRRLDVFAYRSGSVMRPVFAAATSSMQRIVYAEGEDPRVLRAAQIVVDENLAHPVLLGRKEAIQDSIRTLNLRLRPGMDFTVFDPRSIAQPHPLGAGAAHHEDERTADTNVPRLAAMLLDNDEADALICGLGDRLYSDYLAAIDEQFSIHPNGPSRDDGGLRAAMNLLLLPKHALFICDTHVNGNPTAAQLADIVTLAADELGHFGLIPHIGIVAPARHCPTDTTRKVETALALIRKRHPDLMVAGPIQADVAIADAAISQINLLILPNLDTANIAYNILRMFSGEGLTVGPILLGTKKPRHILSSTHTVRGIVNMTALAAAQAMACKQPRAGRDIVT